MRLYPLMAVKRPVGRTRRHVQRSEFSAAAWLKSSLSAANGNCLEAARLSSDHVAVRDTKDNARGPVLVFTRAEWDAFLGGAKQGEFDHL